MKLEMTTLSLIIPLSILAFAVAIGGLIIISNMVIK